MVFILSMGPIVTLRLVGANRILAVVRYPTNQGILQFYDRS